MTGPSSKWTLLGAAFAVALTAGLTGAAASTTVDATPSVYTAIPAHALPVKTIAGSGNTTRLVAGGTTTVPDDATSVVMQVVVSNGATNGSMTIDPWGSPPSPAAVIRWNAGETVTAQITVAVGNQDKVILRNDGTGSVQADLTLTGYYTPAGATGPAGGVLTGSYPNPGLAAHSVTAGKLSAAGGAAGDVLTNNGSGVVWQTPNYESALTDSIVVHPSGDSTTDGDALRTAVASGKNLVVVEPGLYALTGSPLSIPGGVNIVGAGRDVSEISFSGTGSAITTSGLVTISDIGLVQSTGSADGQVITLSGSGNLTLQHVAVTITSSDAGANSFAAGVVVNDSSTLVVADTTVTASGPHNFVEGILVNSSSANATITESTVTVSNSGTGNQDLAVNSFGPTTVRNSTISGTATASGLGNAVSSQAAGVTVNVYGSVLKASAYAAGSYAGTLNVAQTQIMGLAGHNPSAVLVCVGAFNTNFAPLSGSCA